MTAQTGLPTRVRAIGWLAISDFGKVQQYA